MDAKFNIFKTINKSGIKIIIVRISKKLTKIKKELNLSGLKLIDYFI